MTCCLQGSGLETRKLEIAGFWRISFLHLRIPRVFLFFFNDTATTEIYTLSLHDALPISGPSTVVSSAAPCKEDDSGVGTRARSDEPTSELPSRSDLVCRLLLVKIKI